MSQPSNPYQKKTPAAVNTDDNDNISMKEASPSSKNSSDDSKNEADGKQDDNHSPSSRQSNTGEGGNFDDQPFQIPPSFRRPITEETLQDEACPYAFWASLHLPIPFTPVNLMAAVYDALEEFVMQLADEDLNFVMYPYNLSWYELIEDLPPPIKTLEDLPKNIDEWLEYFLGMKPWVTSRDMYMALLIGLSIPLPKLVKNLSMWMQNK